MEYLSNNDDSKNDMTEITGCIVARVGKPVSVGWLNSAIIFGMNKHVRKQIEPSTTTAEKLADLINIVAKKDRRAFDVLYDMTTQRMYSVAIRITKQHVLAEEAVSDAFLQVWQQADRYSTARGSVIAWMCVLCRSRALDTLRRENSSIRQAEVNLEFLPEQEDTNTPPDIVESIEQSSAVHAALNKLTPQQQQLLSLAYFKGYTHSELAIITNMPTGTVKTQIYRTMITLKKFMPNVLGANGEFND